MKKETRKKVIGFVLFVTIALTLFAAATWLFRGNDEEARVDLVAFKNQENIDVVMYGGSTFLRYFSPLDAWNREGMVSYNYATSAARMDIAKEYIQESRRTNEAMLYVVDVRTLPMVEKDVHDQPLRNWSDSLPLFSPVRWKGISHYLFTRDWKNADIPSFYFDIIKYHGNTSALSYYSQWKFLTQKRVNNPDKGFAPNISSVVFERPEVLEDRGELTEQQENALNDLLDYCDRENLPVLFTVCPYCITESDWKVLNTCGDLIESRGYRFINFNRYYDEIGLDFETDFSDVNHVNYIGAAKYTRYLLDYLKSNYDIPDRRGDSAYAQWDDDYEDFSFAEAEWLDHLTEIIDCRVEAYEKGQALSAVTDFEKWYNTACSENYTLVINKTSARNPESGNDAYQEFLKGIGVQNNEMYAGLWCGSQCLLSTRNGETLELPIGVDGGRGQTLCVISAGGISVAEENYAQQNADLQLLLYDNNYREVVDRVYVVTDASGEIHLER